MHPEILRELTSQRGREMRERAHQGTLARIARRARRRGQSGLDYEDQFVVPAIPDYVDGSFRVPSADDQAAEQPGQVPTTGRAA